MDVMNHGRRDGRREVHYRVKKVALKGGSEI